LQKGKRDGFREVSMFGLKALKGTPQKWAPQKTNPKTSSSSSSSSSSSYLIQANMAHRSK